MSKKLETDNGLATVQPAPLAPRSLVDVPISAVLQAAIEKGIDPSGLEKLVALYERMSETAARKEFAQALADFQAECPSIAKTSEAQIATRSGGSYSYKYAELDAIAGTIRPLLQKHGLSYTWDSSFANGVLECTCTVRHANGHSVSAKFSCPTDSASAMSSQQKNAAALTFARRQSLIQVLGLTTCDSDNDGAEARARESVKITEHQAANLEALIADVNADSKRFLAFFGIERLSDLPAGKFHDAVRALESKRKGNA